MDYYLGQIGIYGFNFAPQGWALCAGSVLPISQNTALYSLIGWTYGGDGATTFALPDLRSRTPLHFGPLTQFGQPGGTEGVTLIASNMPAHNHMMAVNNAAATVKVPKDNVFAQATDGTNALPAYSTSGNLTLNAQTVSQAGGSLPHSNIQPCLAVNFCIATTGNFPARN